MIRPDEEVPLTLTAADINVVLAGLGELPYRVSALIIDKVRQQVIAHDPAAFDQPTQAPPPRLNGVDVRQ